MLLMIQEDDIIVAKDIMDLNGYDKSSTGPLELGMPVKDWVDLW